MRNRILVSIVILIVTLLNPVASRADVTTSAGSRVGDGAGLGAASDGSDEDDEEVAPRDGGGTGRPPPAHAPSRRAGASRAAVRSTRWHELCI